jgi:hypothetical protein
MSLEKRGKATGQAETSFLKLRMFECARPVGSCVPSDKREKPRRRCGNVEIALSAISKGVDDDGKLDVEL